MSNWRTQAANDIKSAEACKLVAYLDSEGVWTIGWGHTHNVKPGDTCTQAQADAWFEWDFENAEEILDWNLSYWPLLPPAIKRGLINMSFNLGWPRLRAFSKMLDAAKSRDWGRMATEALDSKWAVQVPSRAKFIADLFRGLAAAPEQLELEV